MVDRGQERERERRAAAERGEYEHAQGADAGHWVALPT
jgi:hypothetical protein